MKYYEVLIDKIKKGSVDEALNNICSDDEDEKSLYRDRLIRLTENYAANFGDSEDIRFFSAPGRTEIGGNHTDHQNGCVLAAAVNMDTTAAAAVNDTNFIRILSEGYPMSVVDLNERIPIPEEINTTSALIRGVAAKIIDLGYPVRGFNAYVNSTVLKGSGLSSSAAYEVLVGSVINGLFCNGKIDPVQIAQIGKYAENIFFGKPSGLMDQMASSVGSVVFIDFKDPAVPVIEKIGFDIKKAGYILCTIDSGANHADLTGEYAAIPGEMGAVAAYFGEKVLRNVDEGDFYEHLVEIRKIVGDRAILRAMHFFAENKRASVEAELLKENKIDQFLNVVNESGRSSYMYLQNVIVSGEKKNQELAYVLGLCDHILKGHGAFRIQGGGFAGTIQAFVPIDMIHDFKEVIEKNVGKGACHLLSFRASGGVEIKEL